MTKRPNFILFMTYQQRVDYLGCTGHPVLKTPNIDALAENPALIACRYLFFMHK